MESIKFYKVNDEYGWLSNFSKHPFVLDGIYWPTVEHYFQAQKCIEIADFLKIQAAESAFIAAELGRNRNLKILKNWDSIRIEIMYNAVLAKFSQNPEIAELLINTKNCPIIEHTENDSFWADGGNGTGLNKLGEIIMQVRRELLKEKIEFLPPWEKYPDKSVYDMFWKMGNGEDYLTNWYIMLRGLDVQGKDLYFKKYNMPKDWETGIKK
jgi:ribA/ribD-fused uncharacterized protein